jgi:hypothetical protein
MEANAPRHIGNQEDDGEGTATGEVNAEVTPTGAAELPEGQPDRTVKQFDPSDRIAVATRRPTTRAAGRLASQSTKEASFTFQAISETMRKRKGEQSAADQIERLTFIVTELAARLAKAEEQRQREAEQVREHWEGVVTTLQRQRTEEGKKRRTE